MPEDPDPDRLLVCWPCVGDEDALADLMGKYRAMLSIALSYIPSLAMAGEVVQDVWREVLRGIEALEGRSSLRTWLFRILINRAISAGTRQRRSVPVGDMRPVVDASRFDAAGSWNAQPEPWAGLAEGRTTAAKMAARIAAAIDELPLQQKEVVTLRNLQCLTSGEAFAVLGISAANQLVLLHRGRSKLRQVIAREFGSAR